jgi:myosin-3
MTTQKINLDQFPAPGDRYTLENPLGGGVFGRVFAATDTRASYKKVAIKIQKVSENSRPYVEQEYRVLRDLSSHANLPDFYGIYRKEDDIWFVMEVRGRIIAAGSP